MPEDREHGDEIDRLVASLDSAAAVRDARMADDYALLVGLARTYVECRNRYGTPGQPTFMAFPSIQGSRLRFAVEKLAAIGGSLEISDPDGVAERARRAIGIEDEK